MNMILFLLAAPILLYWFCGKILEVDNKAHELVENHHRDNRENPEEGALAKLHRH